MKAPIGRCLYCGQASEGNGDFHSRCSGKFFGTKAAPRLEHGLAEMDTLAARVLRAHSAVPGVQTKISLDLEKASGPGKAGRLTLVGLWGRYILKPPTSRFPHLPENEDTTMRLAAAAGIPVVPHALIRMASGELAYLTRRIDRSEAGKIAMEDLCQLSGRLTEDKYKGSLEAVGKVIRGFSSQPGLDAVRFFELALFCFLTGNADMHLKNFSLWIPVPGEPQLSPAYDLLATKLVLPKDEEETALALNGKKKNLRRKDFQALADNLGIPAPASEKAFTRMLGARKKWGKILEGSFLPAPVRRDYLDLVAARAARLKAA